MCSVMWCGVSITQCDKLHLQEYPSPNYDFKTQFFSVIPKFTRFFSQAVWRHFRVPIAPIPVVVHNFLSAF